MQPAGIMGLQMPYLLALLFLVTATAAAAQPAYVIDGDTLDLAGERIRLWASMLWRAIRSASATAARGAAAMMRPGPEALVDGHELMCEARDVDRYGRTAATCTVGGQDLGAAMVRQGWALDHEWYSVGGTRLSSTRPSRRNAGCGRARSSRRGSGGRVNTDDRVAGPGQGRGKIAYLSGRGMDSSRLVGFIGTPKAAGGLTISHWFMSFGHHRISRAARSSSETFGLRHARWRKKPIIRADTIAARSWGFL
jgi:hypothetical protein